jgi:hypothetical protein
MGQGRKMNSKEILHQREIDAWVAVWLTGNKKYSKRGKKNGNFNR